MGRKRLKKKPGPRMAMTVDFYDKEVHEGIAGLAILSKKSRSEYLREVLTEHYNNKRALLK